MCPPVGLVLAAGTALSAVGQISSGVAARQSADANAAMLRARAVDVEQKARYDIDQLKREFSRKQGTTLAKVAGSGLNAATFADILADDAAEAFLEQKAVRYGAEIEKAGLNNQATMQKAEGRNAQTAGFISAAGTVAGGYMRASKMGFIGDSSGAGVSLGTSDTWK